LPPLCGPSMDPEPPGGRASSHATEGWELSGKVVGVLGGMGPEATADFMLKLVKATPARCDKDHLQVVVVSNPAIPDRTAAITGGGEDPVPAMVGAARVLVRAGADIIAIPCNSAHFFYERLQSSVPVPVLHIVRECVADAAALVDPGAGIGILATTGTIRSELYQRELEACGLVAVLPDAREQERVMDAIYGPEGVKAGFGDQPRRELASVAGALARRGARAIAAACTEIPLALRPADVDAPLVDSTWSLARAAVREALGIVARCPAQGIRDDAPGNTTV